METVMLSNWFRNLPVKRKIMLVVGYFSLVLLAILFLAIKNVRACQQRTEAMYHQNLQSAADLTMVRTSMLRALVLANNVMRASSPEQAA